MNTSIAAADIQRSVSYPTHGDLDEAAVPRRDATPSVFASHEYAREACAIRPLGPGITLLVEPHVVQPRSSFQATHGPYCVGVDGRVVGPSWVDRERKQANLDHHVGVDRLATPCAAKQMHEFIVSGGFSETFSTPEGEPCAVLCVKSDDPDEAMCAAQLANVKRVTDPRYAAAVKQLVDFEDSVDRPGGACGMNPQDRMAQQVAYICEPYERFRLSERRGSRSGDGAAMAQVIVEISERFWQTAAGKGGLRQLDTRYSCLDRGHACPLIHEQGFYGRVGLFQDSKAEGYRAFIAVREVGAGLYRYTIGKLPGGEHFPVSALYQIFNAAEYLDRSSPDRWDGSDWIGGSPQMSESRLHPRTVSAIKNAFLSYCAGEKPQPILGAGIWSGRRDRVYEESLAAYDAPPEIARRLALVPPIGRVDDMVYEFIMKELPKFVGWPETRRRSS